MSKIITEEDILKAKGVDIVKFLEVNGHDVKQKHNYMLTSSPFTSDSNPSFVVYTDHNIYVDYSSANRGDSIDLAMKMFKCGFKEAVERLTESELPEWDEKVYEKTGRKRKPFKLKNYLTNDQEEIEKIDNYAISRKIDRGYSRGFYYVSDGNDGWERKLAMIFPHRDNWGGYVVGAKFRNIDPSDPNRFTARGRLSGFYLRNTKWDNPLDIIYRVYIVESETSAISLWRLLTQKGISSLVISFGGVANVPKELPYNWYNLGGAELARDNVPLVRPRVIIDYDGNEELYQERLRAYEHFNGIPIKLELPKGEDINSLWARGETENLASLLL